MDRTGRIIVFSVIGAVAANAFANGKVLGTHADIAGGLAKVIAYAPTSGSTATVDFQHVHPVFIDNGLYPDARATEEELIGAARQRSHSDWSSGRDTDAPLYIHVAHISNPT